MEQGLNDECTKEELQLTEPKTTIPDESALPIPYKLWTYMESRMQSVAGKVEKERVNTCGKEMYTIKAEIYKYREKDQRTIAQLEQNIKDKLTQLNHTFAQLKHTPIEQHQPLHDTMEKLKK